MPLYDLYAHLNFNNLQKYGGNVLENSSLEDQGRNGRYRHERTCSGQNWHSSVSGCFGFKTITIATI